MNERFDEIEETLREAEDMKSSFGILIDNLRDMVEHYEEVDILLEDVKGFLINMTYNGWLEYKESRDIERLIERVKKYTDK